MKKLLLISILGAIVFTANSQKIKLESLGIGLQTLSYRQAHFTTAEVHKMAKNHELLKYEFSNGENGVSIFGTNTRSVELIIRRFKKDEEYFAKLYGIEFEVYEQFRLVSWGHSVERHIVKEFFDDRAGIVTLDSVVEKEFVLNTTASLQAINLSKYFRSQYNSKFNFVFGLKLKMGALIQPTTGLYYRENYGYVYSTPKQEGFASQRSGITNQSGSLNGLTTYLVNIGVPIMIEYRLSKSKKILSNITLDLRANLSSNTIFISGIDAKQFLSNSGGVGIKYQL